MAISTFILSDVCCDICMDSRKLAPILLKPQLVRLEYGSLTSIDHHSSQMTMKLLYIIIYKIHRYCHSIYFACFRLIVINYSEFRSAHAETIKINSSLSLRWIIISWVSEIAFHSQCQHYSISSKPLHDCRLQAITLAIMPTERDYPEVAWYLM